MQLHRGTFRAINDVISYDEKNKSFILTEKTNYQFNSKDIKHYNVVQINRREFTFFFKLIILFVQTLIILVKEKPDVVISTGALATVPMCLLAKLFRKN